MAAGPTSEMVISVMRSGVSRHAAASSVIVMPDHAATCAVLAALPAAAAHPAGATRGGSIAVMIDRVHSLRGATGTAPTNGSNGVPAIPVVHRIGERASRLRLIATNTTAGFSRRFFCIRNAASPLRHGV